MTITKLLERNADLYGDEIALMEINLTLQDEHHVIWREYELIENNPAGEYRLEMSWRVFDEKANRLAIFCAVGLVREQGQYFAHELHRVAADLFWCPQVGGYGRSAEFPLYSRRN